MKWRRWAPKLAAWAAVAVVLGLLWWRVSVSTLEAQLNAARAEGLATRVEDLATAPVALAEDPGPHFLAGCAALRSRWRDVGDLRRTSDELRAGPITASEWASAEAAVAAIEPALRHIRKGSLLPAANLRVDWNLGAYLELPNVDQAAEALCAVSRWRAGSNPVAALDELVVAARLSAAIGAVPSLSALSMQSEVVNSVFETTEFVLQQTPITLLVLDKVRRIVSAFGPEVSFRHSIRSELLMTRMSTFRDMFDRGGFDQMNSASWGSAPAAAYLARVAPVRNVFESRLIAYWRAVNRALPEDGSDYLTAFKRIDSLEQQLFGYDSPSGALSRWSELMNRDLVWSTSIAFQRGMESMAKRRLLEAAVETYAFRLRTGHLPSSVKQIDPFSQRPLRLRRTDTGFCVYSVHVDGVDDGGIRQWEGPTRDSYDLALRGGPQFPGLRTLASRSGLSEDE
jgi:hypothetical protein